MSAILGCHESRVLTWFQCDGPASLALISFQVFHIEDQLNVWSPYAYMHFYMKHVTIESSADLYWVPAWHGMKLRVRRPVIACFYYTAAAASDHKYPWTVIDSTCPRAMHFNTVTGLARSSIHVACIMVVRAPTMVHDILSCTIILCYGMLYANGTAGCVGLTKCDAQELNSWGAFEH